MTGCAFCARCGGGRGETVAANVRFVRPSRSPARQTVGVGAQLKTLAVLSVTTIILASSFFYIGPKIPLYIAAYQKPVEPLTLADEMHNRDVYDARRKLGLE